MLTFCETAEGVSLLRNGEPLFSGLRPFVRGQGGERLWLALRSCCPDSAVFEAEGAACNLTLSQEGACASLRLSVRMPPAGGGGRAKSPGSRRGTGTGRRAHCPTRSAGRPIICIAPSGAGAVQALATIWPPSRNRRRRCCGNPAAAAMVMQLTTCDQEFKSHVCGCPEGGVSLLLYSHYRSPVRKRTR